MKKYTFSLLILFITLNIQSQQGWFWQNPLPQGNTLTGSHFLDQTTGYICGGYGTVLFTTNGGTSLITQITNSTDLLFSIYFVNPNTGMAVGLKGAFLRTSNSGNNWFQSYILNNQDLRSICFIDENTGFICGSGGTFAKTTNTGLNWQVLNSGTNVYLTQVYFIDNLTGFVIGENGVTLKSTNAGLSWNFTSIVSNYLWSICFLNINTGFIMGSGVVLKTTNSGSNWENTNLFLGNINSLSKFDSTNLIAVGGGRIYISSNSGSNWILSYSKTNIIFQNTITLNDNTAYVFGLGGTMMKTTNKGISWSGNSNGFLNNINSIKFFDINFGAASCSDGSILTTSNSGINWSRKIIDTTSNTDVMSDIVLKNESEFLAVGQNGRIYKTTNSGLNWIVSYSAIGNLNKIRFSNYYTGYAAGNNGLFLKTTNNGYNWFAPSVLPHAINDFVIKDSLTIFNATSHGIIYKSTNSGYNWIEVATGFSSLSSIKFVNNIGFACGDYGFVIRSTNGGDNWSSVFNNEDLYNLNDLYFIDNSTGYFVGIDYEAHGLIYKTTNMGLNWFSLYSGTSNTLNSIVFTGQNTGYVVGSFGTIIKTTNGGGAPIGIEPVSNNVPVDYKLIQNYPNPFNPVTKIKFSIPQNSNSLPVNIYIYDVTGREIQSFSYNNLQPGTYSVDFDGTNLASGLYFYQFVSEDFTQTRKMVLLK